MSDILFVQFLYVDDIWYIVPYFLCKKWKVLILYRIYGIEPIKNSIILLENNIDNLNYFIYHLLEKDFLSDRIHALGCDVTAIYDVIPVKFLIYIIHRLIEIQIDVDEPY